MYPWVDATLATPSGDVPIKVRVDVMWNRTRYAWSGDFDLADQADVRRLSEASAAEPLQLNADYVSGLVAVTNLKKEPGSGRFTARFIGAGPMEGPGGIGSPRAQGLAGHSEWYAVSHGDVRGGRDSHHP